MQLNLSSNVNLALYRGQNHSVVSGIMYLLQVHCPHLANKFINRYSIIMNNIYPTILLDTVQAMNLFWLRELSFIGASFLTLPVRERLNGSVDICTYLDDFERNVIPMISTNLNWSLI